MRTVGARNKGGIVLVPNAITDKFLTILVCETMDVTYAYKTVKEKGRSNYFILYIAKGSCTVVECGEAIEAKAGSVILYAPGERQEYFFAENSGATIYYALFNGEGCSEIIHSEGLSKRITMIADLKKYELLFSEFVEEFHAKKPFWKQSTCALLQRLLVETVRSSDKKIFPTAHHEIYDVIRYMHNNYQNNHSVAFFAAQAHLCEGRFSHVFKEITGLPPKQYLQKLKIDNAKALLYATPLSVPEVAAMVGIHNINYFIRHFKRHTGISPKNMIQPK